MHAPPESRSLATVINIVDDWDKVVEEFGLCDGVMTDNDRRTLPLKKLRSTVRSSLVSSLRKCESYEAMKKELVNCEMVHTNSKKYDSKANGQVEKAIQEVEGQVRALTLHMGAWLGRRGRGGGWRPRALKS